MTRDTRGQRVVEWADLVGESVPDGVADAADRQTPEPWDGHDADRR